MLLHSLVFSIEICGISANESFKTFAKSGDIKKSYAHGLWNDTKRNNPDKIVALREQIARDLVSDHAQWMESDRAKDPPTTRSVFSRLEREDPALLYSAFREWYLESKEINNGDSIPTYEEWVKAVEMDTLPDTDILSLYKEIASSE